MVIADAECPSPVRKRPRLSLKVKTGFRKDEKTNACMQIVSTENDKEEIPAVHKISYHLDEQKEKTKLVPAVTSLENLGNTCFLNSILQVLRYTPGFLSGLNTLYQEIIFIEKFRKQEAKEEEDKDSFLTWDLVKHLFKLYRSMEKREKNHSEIASDDVMSMALKPDRILNIIRELNPMFEGNLQHDAQEVLRCVLSYLQDAAKEIRKAKNLLPPSLCPTQTKGPVNPIMQKFLKIKSEKSMDNEKSINPVAMTQSVFSHENGMDFLDHIDKSEAAKTVAQESSNDPMEADVPSSKMLNQSSPDIEKGEESPVSSTKTVSDNEIMGKRSNSNKRKSETDVPVSMVTENSTDPQNSDNKETRKSKRSRKITEKAQLMIQAKKEKVVGKDEVKGHGLLQPSILSMLGSSNKRLGMRGAVVRKNDASNGFHDNKSESIVNGIETIPVKSQTFSNASKNTRLAMYGITGEKISGKRTFGGVSPRKALRSPSPTTTVQISPRKDNTNDTAMDFVKDDDSGSPAKLSTDFQKLDCHEVNDLDLSSKKSRQPVVKLEKCDHVCDSPKKSVNAGYAEKTLSPYKTNMNLSQKTGLAKQKLDFSSKESQSTNCQVLNGRIVKPKKENVSQAIENKTPKRDFVETLFMGSMMLRTKCLECEFSRERSEEFHDISVPVKIEKCDDDDENSMDSVSDNSCLARLMEAFTEAERLCDNNKYYCDKCIRHVEAERSLHYEVLPDVLTVHLKRFSSSTGFYGYVSKINDHVTIPLCLPCLRYKCPNPCNRADHRYRLYALVTHAGMTLTSGHYLSYVRVMDTDRQFHLSDSDMQFSATMKSLVNDDRILGNCEKDFLGVPKRNYLGKWLECDDESIRVHSEDDFCSMLQGVDGALLGTPYVLFYHRLTQEDH